MHHFPQEVLDVGYFLDLGTSFRLSLVDIITVPCMMPLNCFKGRLDNFL